MFPIKSCFKWASVKFRASAYEDAHYAQCRFKGHEKGFWDYQLNRHLKAGAQFDGIHVAYTMVHPDARRETSDDMCYFNDASLPFIDDKSLKYFADVLSTPFDEAGVNQWITFESFRDHPGGGPCSRGTIPADTTGIGNPRTIIIFNIAIKDAEHVANMMEKIGYEEIPPNKTVVADIRKGLQKIAEYNAAKDAPAPSD